MRPCWLSGCLDDALKGAASWTQAKQSAPSDRHVSNGRRISNTNFTRINMNISVFGEFDVKLFCFYLARNCTLCIYKRTVGSFCWCCLLHLHLAVVYYQLFLIGASGGFSSIWKPKMIRYISSFLLYFSFFCVEICLKTLFWCFQEVFYQHLYPGRGAGGCKQSQRAVLCMKDAAVWFSQFSQNVTDGSLLHG